MGAGLACMPALVNAQPRRGVGGEANCEGLLQLRDVFNGWA